MKKISFLTCLLWLAVGCGIAGAQDDATTPEASDTVAAQPAYDDVSQPGQIHGFIPETWSASMITLVDLQTQDGQDWFTSLTAAQSIQGQTQYVCQNPGPTTTSSDTGDFYFYDLPAGSYVVAACLQTPDGHWRSGAQVVALEAGRDDLVALGPSGGPIVREGQAFVPAYYLGLWDPMWFGPGWGWGWHTAAWQPSVYYSAPLYRSAPIWVRPASIVAGVRIFVPPYKEVVGGGYHYLAYRNGGFVRESPRTGILLPPKHQFHPVTPEAEARIHVGTLGRSGGGGQLKNTEYVGGQPPTTSPARPSPFVNYHPMAPAAATVPHYNQPNNQAGSRPVTGGNGGGGWQGQTTPQTTNRPAPQVTTQRPVQQAPSPQEYHLPPPVQPEHHAPPPSTESKPTTKKPY
jgi:hypothetical protein